MPSATPHSGQESWRAIALDFLAEKDTLASLAQLHQVSIHQILEWKERLVRDLGRSRNITAA